MNRGSPRPQRPTGSASVRNTATTAGRRGWRISSAGKGNSNKSGRSSTTGSTTSRGPSRSRSRSPRTATSSRLRSQSHAVIPASATSRRSTSPRRRPTGGPPVTATAVPTPPHTAQARMRSPVRRAAPNPSSASGNVKVVVRVRPMNQAESQQGLAPVVAATDDFTSLAVTTPGNGSRPLTKAYRFFKCIPANATQEQMFERSDIKPLLDSALDGYAATVFAYGQTGSGKTFTMSGTEERIVDDGFSDSEVTAGIIPRAVAYIFDQLGQREDSDTFTVRSTYCEVYNEQVYDLLNLSEEGLAVRWHSRAKRFYVPDLLQIDCKSHADVMTLVTEGHRNRRIRSTALNKDSSRSHSLLTITIESKTRDKTDGHAVVKFGKVVFVDLAGSERESFSKVEGEAAKETRQINLSLLSLGKVISCLAQQAVASSGSGSGSAPGSAGPRRAALRREGSGRSGTPGRGSVAVHVPYRDSKLTKLLMDSLGGSALTLMISCVSPNPKHMEDTLNTVNYAMRASSIKNKPTIQLSANEQLLLNLRKEIAHLKEENELLKSRLEGDADSGDDGVQAEVLQVLTPRGTGTPSTPSTTPGLSPGGKKTSAGRMLPTLTPPPEEEGARKPAPSTAPSSSATATATTNGRRKSTIPQPSRVASMTSVRGQGSSRTDVRQRQEYRQMVDKYSKEIDRLTAELSSQHKLRETMEENYSAVMEENERLSTKLEHFESMFLSDVSGSATSGAGDGGGAGGDKRPTTPFLDEEGAPAKDVGPTKDELKEAMRRLVQENEALSRRLEVANHKHALQLRATMANTSSLKDVLARSREVFASTREMVGKSASTAAMPTRMVGQSRNQTAAAGTGAGAGSASVSESNESAAFDTRVRRGIAEVGAAEFNARFGEDLEGLGVASVPSPVSYGSRSPTSENDASSVELKSDGRASKPSPTETNDSNPTNSRDVPAAPSGVKPPVGGRVKKPRAVPRRPKKVNPGTATTGVVPKSAG